MTEQKAKFGVLVQRGKEQYVIEGGEHPVPPKLVPTPPPTGWLCVHDRDIYCNTIHEGEGCKGHFKEICQKGEKDNLESYAINLGCIPVGENSTNLRLGTWQFDQNFGNHDNVYGQPYNFLYLIKADGDVEAFKYFVNDEAKDPNTEFSLGDFKNHLEIKYDPLVPGNYTVSVGLEFRIGPCTNCTFTPLIPSFYAFGNWTISVSCIERMIDPYKLYDFDTLNIYESRDANFTIKNNINTTLLADVWIDGPDYLDFDIIEGPKGKFYLWPNNHTNIKIRWNPQVLGNQTAKLNISCDNGYWDYCYLTGFSEKPPCEYLAIYPDKEYSFGEVLVGSKEEHTFLILNSYPADIYINVKLEGDNDFRIKDGGVRKIEGFWNSDTTVEFAPTSIGDKEAYLILEPCNVSCLIRGIGKAAIIFEPWEYDFGKIQLKHCSDTIPFTLKNIGEEDAFVSVSIRGDTNSNFTLIEGFNETLYAGNEGTVRVRFCPNQFGNATAYLCAEVTAEADEYINITAVLHGKGTFQYAEPHISISPSDVQFPDTYPGMTSSKSITVKNEGAEKAYIKLSVDPEGIFDIEKKNTTINIKAGASKEFDVCFSPVSEGNFTGQIIANCLNGNIATITIHGKSPSPPCDAIIISPSFHDFGAVRRNKISDTVNFTIKNEWIVVFNFTVSLSGPDASQFTILEGEGDQSLAPLEECGIKVQFNPTEVGNKTAYLTISPYAPICDNISATLIGECRPDCRLYIYPEEYDFGEVIVNKCSPTANFSIMNYGSDPARCNVLLWGLSMENFTIVEYPNITLHPGEVSIIGVKYCPNNTGSHITSLVAMGYDCDNNFATLTGKGIPAPPTAPNFTISPSIFDFGEVKINESSDTQEFILRNVGEDKGIITANITGPDADNFALVGQSGKRTMLPGCFHKFKVKFSPDEPRNFTAKLWINTSWSGGEIPDVYATLYGVGKTHYDFEIKPSSVSFGEVLVNEISQPKTVYLKNLGMNATVYVHLASGENFEILSGAGYHYIEENASLPITIGFKPRDEYYYYDYLKVEHPSVSKSCLLSGIGKPRCNIVIEPENYDFGKVYVGETSQSKSFKISNKGKGEAAVNIEIDGVDADNWTIMNAALNNIYLAQGDSISLDIQFAPSTTGRKSAYLVVTPDACSYSWIKLEGEGIERPPCPLEINPSAIDFGSVGVHDYSGNQTVVLSNKDQVAAHLTLFMEGPDHQDFSVYFENFTLPANSSMTFLFKFRPSSPGRKIAWLDIKSNNCTSGIIVYLQGEGLPLDAGSPDWDPDPPTSTPVENRWQALGAVSRDIPPSYGFLIAHAPKTTWLNNPLSPVFVYYLDPKGCLWARGYYGELYIYNLQNGNLTSFNLGAGNNPLFTLGELKSSGNSIELCYYLEPNFIVFAESEWNGEMWSEPREITRWTTKAAIVNMIYWLPPNFLFLIEGDDNRVELWNRDEGLKNTLSLDFPPHYATRDKNGRIWISGRDTNKLISFNTELEDEDIEIYSSSRKFTGIGSSSQYDIVAIDKANEELIIRLAEESYAKSYKISLPGVQEGCSRWEGGYCLFTTNNDALIGIHLRDAALGDSNRRITLGAFTQNVNLRGDAGLLMYSEWGWRWQPDTTVLNMKYVGLL